MKKKILILFFCPIFLFSNLIYKYDEKTQNIKNEILWTLEQDNNLIRIVGEDNSSTTLLFFSKNFDLFKLIYKAKNEATEYVFFLRKGILTAKGKINNKYLMKKHSLTSPWIQQFGFGLKNFVLSKNFSMKFCLLNPQDFSLQKMVAKKEDKETISVKGKTYETQKVIVTLPGFKSLFWKAELWFDSKTGDLIKYMATQGPKTPMTIMELDYIKKEETSK